MARHTLIFLAAFLFSSLAVHAQSNFDLGMSWYKKREQGAMGLKAKDEPIRNAIHYFEQAVANKENEEMAAVYLLKSYFYQGTFVYADEKKQDGIFRRGMNFGESMAKAYPNSAAIQFWYMVNMGKWAELKGAMAAATKGVASKMKSTCERVIQLDPAYEEAGAHRALGMLHYKVPHIPFVMSWPDEDEAVKNLERSLEVAPENPGNHVAYAEVLYGMGYKKKAINILNGILGKKPRKDLFLEDKMEIREAERLLKEFME